MGGKDDRGLSNELEIKKKLIAIATEKVSSTLPKVVKTPFKAPFSLGGLAFIPLTITPKFYVGPNVTAYRGGHTGR